MATSKVGSKRGICVMCRHGDSEWNRLNLFCGWYNANLSDKGVNEAISAGKIIKKGGFKFDFVHTSVLNRAKMTCRIILKESNNENVPVLNSWRLNERHYGALTGLNKTETAEKYGIDQVQIWRRSYDIAPPSIDENHKYFKSIVEDPIYKDGPQPWEFPKVESLKMTIARTLPYWNDYIVPQLRQGNSVLIVAHGNSLRGLVKHIDQISDQEITKLNIPTGIPFVYEFEPSNMKPLVQMKFLGDQETVEKAMALVATQINLPK